MKPEPPPLESGALFSLVQNAPYTRLMQVSAFDASGDGNGRAAALDDRLIPWVQRLYEDAAQGRAFAPALESALALLGGKVAHLVASDRISQQPLWAEAADRVGGQLLASAERYDASLYREDPRRVVGMQKLARTGAWRCQELIDDRVVGRSAFFQQFFLPLGLRHSAVVRLPGCAGEASHVDLALVRGPDEAPFEALDLQRLRGLALHLRTALGIRRMVEDARAADAALAAAATDSLVLDHSFRPVAGTPGALSQVAGAFGRVLLGRDARRRSQPCLESKLAAVLKDGLSRHLALGPDEGLSERLWVTATRRHDAGTGRPELLLLLRWPDRRREPNLEELRALLGLSRREAAVAVELLKGRTAREIWEAEGLSPATVRSQLRSLYAKTGTRGQVELVRLLAQLTVGSAG